MKHYYTKWRSLATLIVLVSFYNVRTGLAQTVALNNFPDNTANSRFYNDSFKDNIVRPSLSIRGFNSSTLTGGTNYGYGLKQILNKVYNNPDPLVVDVYNSILSDASGPLVSPDNRGQIEKNSRIIQARAFVALVVYLLEKNGNDINSLN